MKNKIEYIIREEICFVIDNLVEKFASEKVRIKFEKDVYSNVLGNIIKKYPQYHLSITRKIVYKVLKSIEPLKEDPDKPREFITYKTKWKEFRKKF